jgi:hypothetical protein
MGVNKLKNLIRETKEISKRILEELGNLAKPKLQPIPVPIRKNFQHAKLTPYITVRNYTTCGFGCNQHKPFNGFIKLKFFQFTFKNFTRNFHKNSKILNLVPKSGFYYNHFSQTNNIFRKKLYHSVNATFWNRLKNMNFVSENSGENRNRFVSLKVRVNISLSKDYHQLLIKFSKNEVINADHYPELSTNPITTSGCYVEFPISFSFNIDETILNLDVIDDMITNIELFQFKLKNLKSDLLALFDLGELPIKYDSKRGVIKVYFPNCDSEKVKILLQEKGVVGGVIVQEHQSVSNTEVQIQDSDFSSDILSSSGLTNSVTSYNDDDDILSESLKDQIHLVRLTEDDVVPGLVSIEDDEFHWI